MPNLPLGASAASVKILIDDRWFERQRLEDNCRRIAEQRLQELGLSVDSDSRERLARAVGHVMQSTAHTLQRFGRGDYGPDPNAPQYPELLGHNVPVNPSRASVDFEVLVDGWAAEKHPSPKTLYSWRRVMAQLAGFVGHRDTARLTVDDVVRWKAQLVADGLRAKTIREGKLAPVRAILQWGADNRKLASNVAERGKHPAGAALFG
jgi:hypothetical protein